MSERCVFCHEETGELVRICKCSSYHDQCLMMAFSASRRRDCSICKAPLGFDWQVSALQSIVSIGRELLTSILMTFALQSYLMHYFAVILALLRVCQRDHPSPLLNYTLVSHEPFLALLILDAFAITVLVCVWGRRRLFSSPQAWQIFQVFGLPVVALLLSPLLSEIARNVQSLRLFFVWSFCWNALQSWHDEKLRLTWRAVRRRKNS